MAKTSLRPHYKINTTKTQKEVLEKINDKLKDNSQTIHGQVVQDHAFLRIPEKDQHYWSPEFHVWVREQDGNTRISGVVGPKPKIWTMFMFFYFVVLGLTFFGGIYGIIQWQLDMDAPFLWSIPAGIIGLIIIYSAAKYGQTKGKDQIALLRSLLDDALSEDKV